MSLRLLPVDEADRVVNVLEISIMEKQAGDTLFIRQSGGTESHVSTGHPAYDEWLEIFESGWRYMSNAPIPDSAK